MPYASLARMFMKRQELSENREVVQSAVLVRGRGGGTDPHPAREDLRADSPILFGAHAARAGPREAGCAVHRGITVPALFQLARGVR